MRRTLCNNCLAEKGYKVKRLGLPIFATCSFMNVLAADTITMTEVVRMPGETATMTESFAIPRRHHKYNPFFGDADNQFFINVGTGVNGGLNFPAPIIPEPEQFIPFMMADISYAQPNTFFRLPGRMNIMFISMIGYGEGYGWDWKDVSTWAVTLSQDVSLYEWRGFYLGLGTGGGFQRHRNSRISSKLLFQFRTFIGYELTKRSRLEIFTHHMSNGSTTDRNYSYNFFGLGLGYNF